MRFHDNLKLLLIERNLKQADLCRMTGIQTSLMSDYLGGKKSPTIGNAILIAGALHISLDTLVGKEALSAPKEPQSSSILNELCDAARGLSEAEQLCLLDMAEAMKRRLSRGPN